MLPCSNVKSETLIHLTRYNYIQRDWIKIPINELQIEKINNYILNSFLNKKEKTILKDKGYSKADDFYLAKGSYNCLNTCNSWVNNGLKKSDLKASLWTPFDFILIKKYKKH